MSTPKETLEQYKARVATAGGQALKKKHGPNHFRDIGKKGLKTRWGKKKPNLLKKLLFD